nr:integrase, catalytic region, zinc finger, CCHC-type, peptidase aspartic, catalytic [Tanacetum cinerariifolium]
MMANLSEDIQCDGSDTRPPMLDRSDFASWQQRIQLYYRGKENGVNILKSIDEGPFQMGMIRETLVGGAAGTRGAQNRDGNVNSSQARQIKCYNCNAQENEVVLDEEQLLFIAGGHDNADDCDVFDSDIDEAPTVQTMFMAKLSSAYPIYEEAGLSYDSDILSEVHNHDNYQDAICELHEVHEMHDTIQPNCVLDSEAEYISDSNMILVYYVEGLGHNLFSVVNFVILV